MFLQVLKKQVTDLQSMVYYSSGTNQMRLRYKLPDIAYKPFRVSFKSEQYKTQEQQQQKGSIYTH